MFWKYNNTSASQLETILCKEDVTLQDVMDAEDIINECKYENKALINFLAKPDVMEELVTLTTIEPSLEFDERTRFKYPNIACELLTCDVPALNERLASDEALLAKLYAFLDNEPPLNPLLASFFSKIMGVLIARKTEQNWISYQFTCLQVLDFLKAKENFITLLLNHLGTSAIMDLTLKLMTQVEGVEMRQNILNWLDSQQIIQSLVALLDPKIDKERHYNVAQLLCDFIKIARDNQRNSTERNDPDPLLNTLESPDTIALLLEHILGKDKVESCIVGGIQVLLALLDVYKISIPKYDSQNIYSNSNLDDPSDAEERKKIMQNTTISILKRLKDFHNLLLDPPKKAPINTTLGILDPPLGNTRLQVTKLIAATISSNSPELMQELATLGTMEVLLDLFFKFQWNNFLHTQVEACITAALKAQCPAETETESNALSKHLLVNCKLVERILEAWKDNDEQQSQTKAIRKGYMGHLINITNKIVESCAESALGQFLKDSLPEVNEKLNDFKETTLSETNKTQDTLLGGVHPNTSNEDSDEYGDIPFQQSGLTQQQFAQYQIQQLNPQYIETYGFNDDDFNDGDDTLQTIDHRTGMNFDLAEGDLVQQQEMFSQVCSQNINTLGASDDQIFFDRVQNLQTPADCRRLCGQSDAYNSDSDDDSCPTSVDPSMDVDPWASPNKASETPAVPQSDPWAAANKTAVETNTGWADFSSASFTNFEANFSSSVEQKNEAEKDVIVEPDLKVENMEIKSECNDSHETNSVSVDPVAQIVKDCVEVELVEASGDQSKVDANVVVNKERPDMWCFQVRGQGSDANMVLDSNNHHHQNETQINEVFVGDVLKEGESVLIETGSSMVPNKTIKTEPNKEGV